MVHPMFGVIQTGVYRGGWFRQENIRTRDRVCILRQENIRTRDWVCI
mgnify:FL=1